MSNQTMTIGEAAKLCGVKVATIRYYENVSLFPAAERAANNRRTFDQAGVARLRFIRHARELGFEVDAIRHLLELADKPERPCMEVDAIAQAHLAQIESRIKRLTALKKEVRRMITECARGRIGECRIVGVLADHAHCLHDRH